MNRRPPDFPIYLERLDSAQHMARFYWIGVEPTLFGEWATVCRWGRIGTGGQRQEEWFTTPAAAMQAAQAALARKRRRGYRTPDEGRAVHVPDAAISDTQGRATPTSRAQHELDLD